jgi:reactive intermediate/imine deaminase
MRFYRLTINTGFIMTKSIIQTLDAPQAIGTYSQAVKVDRTVYLSGQIPLDPETMNIVEGDVTVQIIRVFENLKAVAIASGGDFSDVVKLNVFLTDLAHFPIVNEIMARYFEKPYPARAAIGVAALPKGAGVEIDAIMVLKLPDYPAS